MRGETAQSLIITPPSVNASFHLSILPSLSPGDFQPPLSFISPTFDFNVKFISHSFPPALNSAFQGRPFIHGSEPLNTFLCSDLWRVGGCGDKQHSAPCEWWWIFSGRLQAPVTQQLLAAVSIWGSRSIIPLTLNDSQGPKSKIRTIVELLIKS